MKLQTLKGFRDFLPKEAKKRQYVVSIIRSVFESFGFEPLETPALEYEEVLLGKYGEEGDKLMYRFTDNGDRKVAMRYDQTVPTSRVVAQYRNDLPFPFKRYQIQPVWRAENTQKGRFREFLQCDADIFGTTSPLADAEVIEAAGTVLKKLGFKTFKILINDRRIFSNLVTRGTIQEKDLLPVIRSIDKIKKIGSEGVLKELIEKGYSTEQSTYLLQTLQDSKPTQTIDTIFSCLKNTNMEKSSYEFDPTLARGLDYYTSIIFEIEIDSYTAGSVCGGGRYDKLIEQLSGTDIPATGFAFGFDRIIDALDELNLFPTELNPVKALVTVFSKELLEKSIQIASRLRSKNISVELFPDENTTLEKQLKYADKKGIPFAIIIGENEKKNKEVTLKNMKTREQKSASIDDVILTLS